MKLASIGFCNNYSNIRAFSKPNSDNNISFTGDAEDKVKAQKYLDRFRKIHGYAHELDKSENPEKFFQDIAKEPIGVRKNFIFNNYKTFSSEERPFYRVMRWASEHASKIFNIVKELDNDSKAQFILDSTDNPFIQSATSGQSELAIEILDLVKTFDKNVQKQFYRLTTFSDKCKGQANFYDYLTGQGFISIANKFKKAAEKVGVKLDDTPDTELDIFGREKEKPNFKVYDEVKTRFADVGGLFNVKDQIQNQLLNILNNPKVKNSDKPGGVLFYGPPGTGKTLLATATAGEAGVPFISTNGSSFVELYVGAGPKHVRELYREARKQAENHESKTAIVFIDEVDAVAGKRGSGSHKESEATLNALLTELDGVDSKENDDVKVITIFATNRKDMLDDAFRKGRIDLEFKIDDPRFSEKSRREILEIAARKKPFENDEVKKKMLDELAQTTSGLSGAELVDIIKRAYRYTLYLGRENTNITKNDMMNAKLESIIGAKNDIEETKDEIEATLAHEAGHAINLLIMNKVFEGENQKSKTPMRKLDYIINESRGNASGVTLSKPGENRRLTVESLISQLVVNYGGYSIEEQMFDGHSDGVSSDLKQSTDLIMDSVTRLGLGSKTRFLSCPVDSGAYGVFANDIKRDLEDYANTSMGISSQISAFVKPFIEKYVKTFTEHKDEQVKIVSGEEFERMFNEWLKENGNQQEYQTLCASVQESIKTFKAQMKSAIGNKM